jgi:hypothetical protein
VRGISTSARAAIVLICALTTLASWAGTAAALSVSRGESYWLVSSSGQVFAFGGARSYGSMAGRHFSGEIVGIVGTPDGRGYWLISSAGQRFAFGDAHRYRYRGAKLRDITGRVTVRSLRGRIVGVALARLTVATPASVKKTSKPKRSTPGPTASGASTGPARGTTTAATGPVPTPSSGPTALTIATTTVPFPVVDLPYSTTLTATGGAAPYTWALSGGSTLPAGLTLTSAGTLAGTATTPGIYTFAVTVTDADGTSASITYLLMVASASESYNWSGYVETTSSAFTSVSGTMTVPTLDAGDATGSALAEWVGIDGDSNSDLIQAGVGADPSDGTYAWWEVLPAAETPISEPVGPGDQVSVSISEVTPLTACSSNSSDDPVSSGVDWTITIADPTRGWSDAVPVCYNGPGSSAEWIAEAPEEQVTQHHQTVDEIAPLAAFSPDIAFDDLSTSTAASALDYMTIWQHAGTPIVCTGSGCQAPTNPTQTATPSVLDSNGFTVAYGPTAPAAP